MRSRGKGSRAGGESQGEFGEVKKVKVVYGLFENANLVLFWGPENILFNATNLA